jgi:hypothetical protein
VPWPGAELEAALEHLRPVLHAGQAVAVELRAVGVEAVAVVAHPQVQMSPTLKPDLDVPGVGVLADVGDGFLDDAEQGQGLLVGAGRVGGRQVEPVLAAQLVGEGAQGLDQAEALEQRRAQVVDDAPLDGDARADGVDEAPEAGLDVGPGRRRGCAAASWRPSWRR